MVDERSLGIADGVQLIAVLLAAGPTGLAPAMMSSPFNTPVKAAKRPLPPWSRHASVDASRCRRSARFRRQAFQQIDEAPCADIALRCQGAVTASASCYMASREITHHATTQNVSLIVVVKNDQNPMASLRPGSTAPDQSVIDAYLRALAIGAHIKKSPRTNWKDTPLHELWRTDPDGMPVEIYARLTENRLAGQPPDALPVFLVPGTSPELV